jgi:hypothetical protein
MSNAEKLSVSLPADQVRWARRAARAGKTTFSGLVSQLIEDKRQHERALAAFEKYFGAKGRVSADEAESIGREWREA